jgi:hypothetical protein
MSASQEVGEIFGEGSGPATALLRSPTVIIAGIGLWGMNLYFFRLFKIDYKFALMNGTTLQARSQHHMMRRSTSSSCASGSGEADDLGSPSPKNRSSHGDSLMGQDPSADGASIAAVPQKAPMSMPIRLDASMINSSPAVHRGNRSSATGTNSMMISSTNPNTPSTDSKRKGSSNEDTTMSSTSMTSSMSMGGGVNLYAFQEDFTAVRLVGLALFLFALLHTTIFVWIDVLGGDAIGAIFAFYTTCVILSVIPYRFQYTKWVRRGVVLVWRRVMELLNPRCYCCNGSNSSLSMTDNDGGRPILPKPVPFIDVFFADAMCSMSKVFFDWGMLWHMASHYPEPVPPDLHSIVIPSLCAAWPYLVRARQCLIMHTVGSYKQDPKRYQHILNAIKYSTSLFPICVSAYQKTVSRTQYPALAEFLENFLVVLLVVNSLYAFAWDVSMDWGMLTDPYSLLLSSSTDVNNKAALATSSTSSQSCQSKCLRPRLRFGLKVSLSILVVNFILRFAWLLRFVQHDLFPSVDEFILMSEFLEIFRRALWNLLRVEWENIKIMSSKEDTTNTSHNSTHGNNNDNIMNMNNMTQSSMGMGGEYDSNLQNAISMVPLSSAPLSAIHATPLVMDMEQAVPGSYSFGKK